MGCIQSTNGKVFVASGIAYHKSNKTLTGSKWKLKRTQAEAKALFTADGTLPADASPLLLEFREFLDEPQLLQNFGKFAKEQEDLSVLKCWADVLDFKNIDESCVEMAHSKAGFIYNRYLKENAVEVLPDNLLEFATVSLLKTMLTETATDEPISSRFFDKIHQKCLDYLCVKLYSAYKNTPLFNSSARKWKETVNRVTVEDFEYFDKLGQGGYGFVVECRKKSTGRRYAMKIQTKVGLLDCYADSPERVICEKQAMVVCHHPFIVSMDYSFQTRTLVLMVMDLCTTGTLADAIQQSRDGKLSEERVRFYSAEIILALAHIHRMGLIFRDLKPANVLLNPDGHIQLVDLGGIVDVNGKMLGYHSALEEGDGLFAPEAEQSNVFTSWMMDEKARMSRDESAITGKQQQQRGSTIRPDIASPFFSHSDAALNRDLGNSDEFTQTRPSYKVASDVTARARSIMGTRAYMAPEVLALQLTAENNGYTASVDFWALGVTMFKMLTGRLPFDKYFLLDFSAYYNFSDKMSADCLDFIADYGAFLKQQFPNSFSTECRDFIEKLLNLNGDTRLGSGGRKGILLIKNQAFFRGLSWNRLLQKQYTPPVAPGLSADSPKPINNSGRKSLGTFVEDHGTTFGEMIQRLDKDALLMYQPLNKEQTYFSTWDFVAPSVLKQEMGVEKEEVERAEKHPSFPTSVIQSLSSLTRNFSNLNPPSEEATTSIHFPDRVSTTSQILKALGQSPSYT